MCKYQNLSQNSFGLIVWCRDCNIYNLYFGNIVLTLDELGFYEFKDSMAHRYSEGGNKRNLDRNKKDILYRTPLDGFRFFFSINDVGSLVALMQAAELNYLQMNYA
jgi:hypothetical protein